MCRITVCQIIKILLKFTLHSFFYSLFMEKKIYIYIYTYAIFKLMFFSTYFLIREFMFATHEEILNRLIIFNNKSISQ